VISGNNIEQNFNHLQTSDMFGTLIKALNRNPNSSEAIKTALLKHLSLIFIVVTKLLFKNSSVINLIYSGPHKALSLQWNPRIGNFIRNQVH
jgi:hypothetical protein